MITLTINGGGCLIWHSFLFSFFGGQMRNEREYQAELIRKLRIIFPGCFILKNDPSEFQGIPDLLILFGDRWAMLECKRSNRDRIGVNQRHYVELFDEMSFAAFINPENESEVLNDLQAAFGAYR